MLLEYQVIHFFEIVSRLTSIASKMNDYIIVVRDKTDADEVPQIFRKL